MQADASTIFDSLFDSIPVLGILWRLVRELFL
jgi:hypothetical protein